MRRTRTIAATIKDAQKFLGKDEEDEESEQDSPPVKKSIKKEKKKPQKKAEKKPKEQKQTPKPKPKKEVKPKKVQAEKKEEKEEVQQAPRRTASRQSEAKLSQGPRKVQSNLSAVSEPGKPTAGIIDACFVVDTTGSMDAYLEKTKDTVLLLVKNIREKTKKNDISVKFAFVAYRDHPPEEETYVTQFKDLCGEKEILKFIEGLDCNGGGDGAEAVHDGLMEAAKKTSWRKSNKVPSLRYIFHIGDQPPHGREYGGYSESWDDGCPCGITIDDIAHKVNIKEIHYRLIKVDEKRLEKMGRIFSGKFTNYEETTLEKGRAEGMDIRISDMVIRELLPDYENDE